MKKSMILMCLMFFSMNVFVYAQTIEVEKTAIQKVIEESYFKAVYINKDAKAMERGFHPDFNMLILHDEQLRLFPVSRWIESVKRSKAKNPDPPQEKYTHNVDFIDVTGHAAIAKIEVFRDAKLIYTDYMSFYKFGKEWKVVNKIFYEKK